MPRPRHIDRPTVLTLTLPLSVRQRLDEHLYSPLERRVPHGAYVQFFTTLLNERFAWRGLDLSAAFGAEPGRHIVRCSPETLALLKEKLL